jgi:hypothetical protein
VEDEGGSAEVKKMGSSPSLLEPSSSISASILGMNCDE